MIIETGFDVGDTVFLLVRSTRPAEGYVATWEVMPAEVTGITIRIGAEAAADLEVAYRVVYPDGQDERLFPEDLIIRDLAEAQEIARERNRGHIAHIERGA